MKITKALLFLAMVAITFSCSKEDDDPKPTTLEQATIGFNKNEPVVAAPAAMTQSNDSYAQMAAGYINSVNAMTSNLAMFTPPSNAVKGSTPVTAINGRVRSTQKEYLVYTWSDVNYGSVTYQIADDGDKYSFEFLIKENGQTAWHRFLYAEEKKDKSAGFLSLYDHTSDTPDVLIRYDWTRSGDNLNFTMSVPGEGDFIIIKINTKTKAGSVEYKFNGLLEYKMTWDAKGNGTWAWYNEDGSIEEQGSWTVS